MKQDSSKALLEKMEDMLQSIKTEIERFARIGKVKIDVVQEKRQQETIYQTLGKRVYEQHKRGNLDLVELEKIIERIDQHVNSIAHYQSNLEKLWHPPEVYKGQDSTPPPPST